MKYFYYILLIIIAVTVVVSIRFFFTPTPQDVALRVNDHLFTSEEISNIIQNSSMYGSPEDNLEDFITREILIQEAHRQGIDREENFRLSIQNFYEQSLIKILMDREFDNTTVSITDTELESYLRLRGSTVRLKQFLCSAKVAPPSGSSDNCKGGEILTIAFDMLSLSLQYALIHMKPGDLTPADTIYGNRQLQYQLVSITESETSSPKTENPEHIRTLLSGEKRSREIDLWIQKLKAHATVETLSALPLNPTVVSDQPAAQQGPTEK